MISGGHRWFTFLMPGIVGGWVLCGCQTAEMAVWNLLPKKDESVVQTQGTSNEIRARLEQLRARWEKELIPVGLGRQTFYDDAVIARKKGSIVRIHGEVSKLNNGDPVLVADKPWETREYKGGVGPYFTVIRNEAGKFMMWYSTGFYGRLRAYGETGYAESDDGVHWVKQRTPFRFDNLVFTRSHGAGIHEDLYDSRLDHRFKAVFGSFDQPHTNIFQDHGLMLAHSRDGRSWHNYHPTYFISNCRTDTGNSLFWDPELKAYRVLTRMEVWPRGVKQFAIPGLEGGRPRIKPEWILIQNERLPKEQGEIYSFYVQKYGDLYIAYMNVLQQDNVNRLFVAVSRDGVTWNYDHIRKGNEYLRIGPPGYFDEGAVWPTSSDLITVGDKHWVYYAGSRYKHVMPPPAGSDKPDAVAIGVAEIRLDGFFHLIMSGMGLLETKSFIWVGDRLEINCDSTKGKLWVEILDGNGQSIPGFSAGNADVNVCNEVHHVVSWNGSSAAGALRGRPVRVRFLFEGEVDLYAFQVLDRQEEPSFNSESQSLGESRDK